MQVTGAQVNACMPYLYGAITAMHNVKIPIEAQIIALAHVIAGTLRAHGVSKKEYMAQMSQSFDEIDPNGAHVRSYPDDDKTA